MKSAFLILPMLALLGFAFWWAIYAWNSVHVQRASMAT